MSESIWLNFSISMKSTLNMYNVSHDEYVSEFDPKHSSSAAAAAAVI